MRGSHLGRMFALLAGAALAPTVSLARPAVEIRYTSHGVPHIRATDMAGAAYGYGWAFAGDNLCLAVDRAVTLAGERSRAHGADAGYLDTMTGTQVGNLDSDAVFRYLLSPAQVERLRSGASADLRALVRGYVAGVNRRIDEPAGPGEGCRAEPGFRKLNEDDVWRRILHVPLLETSHLLVREIAAAAPPGSPPVAAAPDTAALLAQREVLLAGSNAAAFGRRMVAGGSGGVSFSNPHFGWRGGERLYAAQMTVPGKIDVFGASPHGLPFPMMGFSDKVGWSVTHTTDKRSTIYELELDPADPRRYRVGQTIEVMRPVEVSVPTAGGVKTRTIWETRYGPVIQSRQLDWSRQRAYAFADPERGNLRFAAQFMEIAQATSVAQIKASLDRRLGSPWSNLTAADRGGDVLYANITVAGHVTDDQLTRCVVASPARALMDMADVTVLNGSDPSCAWTTDPRAPQPGIIPAALRPSMIRSDMVFNSNDSHWLASLDTSARLEGFQKVIGPEVTARGERTRIALLYGRSLAPDAGGGGVTPQAWEKLFFSARNLTAELVLDDLLADCRARPGVVLPDGAGFDLTAACNVLAGWDRTDRLGARGSVLFGEFVRGLQRVPMTGFALTPKYWRTPFDPAQPLTTPAGFVATEETRQALARAAGRLQAAGVAIDAPLGQVQFVERDGSPIPLSGASYTYHMMVMGAPQAGRLGDPRVGDSYIHVVQLGQGAPSGRFIVTYSQATNPASPHFSDMTRLFSSQQMIDIAFTPAQIAAAQVGATIRLSPSAN